MSVASDAARVQVDLQRLERLLDGIEGGPGALVHRLLQLASQDEAAFWKLLDSSDVWGGAGSLASAALAPNPGHPDAQWRDRVREIREILMDIGAMLMASGRAHPGISSWVLAFSNWNRGEI
ncbi:MAG: hypothetical protein B7Z66_05780 [Chromatiales bacterium 21-64-14]|nr:MAG: hypothetical protein B7Z66_05780 [Chromatiales bacterium 21-64-14]HQU15187.1 hypothetical protein [Gammaproteobacteria bacterium]